MLINVLEEKKDKAGAKTIAWIEDKIKMAIANGDTDIRVDFSGVSVNENFVEDLAKLAAVHHVKLEGLGTKEGEVEAYVATAFFLKATLGVEAFVEWFEERVADADYPLMILDSRIKDGSEGTLGVVKPLYFQDNKLVYQRLQTRFLEPIELEKAVLSGEDIWITESMNKIDIADDKTGLRFACNSKERTMLDIFSGILCKKVKGFVQ
ncbi:hypothetical protein FT641_19935 [Bacillus paranthracis]|uniref:hypothetical protein n=1 Tax=Bacillus paranthracis TaxID=2026186 RepID=UPI00187AD3F1|nr:hypothetical protein [Bacillus paranthracis]MBE7114668.1 hypothetical protein [Bacillus paranthracis]MBE7154965.1 hypothetical protein [Bacillus paranthracis]